MVFATTAILDGSQFPVPIVHVDEDELLSALIKRKGRSALKLDGKGRSTLKPDGKNRSSLKLDGTTMKKGTWGKNKLKLDDDIEDGLLSALLDADVTPTELALRYSSGKGRNKH